MAEARYDTIGKAYNTTRKADPYLASRIYELLDPVRDGLYLEVGCGTANYLTALAQKGLRFYGVDPSAVMLEKARAKDNDAVFVQGIAEELPFQDRHFDGVTAIVTMHHWSDLSKGLSEIARVLKPGGSLVCFSFTPEQLKGYWLNHYFPGTMDNSSKVTPGIEEMFRDFREAGFKRMIYENYSVHEGLQDHFLYSNKNHPEQYLIPEIRNNASSFTVYAHQEEIAPGLESLEADIGSGKIWEIIKSHPGEEGDYIFYKATV
jgi:ubiquinone/menaquinone biosynthesis C-methylase UbiE